MSDRRANENDRLDRLLRASDPSRGRAPAGPGIGGAFDSMSGLIVSEPRRAPRRRRFANRPRVVLTGIAAAALLGAGVAVAATQLFVPTYTHVYPPKGMIVGGGPGELLNLDGSHFRQIALQVSSDIPYPAGYGSWRDSVISMEYQLQCHPRGPTGRCFSTPRVPAGQLHGAFAAAAFDAWVLDWRHDMLTGRQAAAARDARVISGALHWKAVTAWDPHPSTSVPGDMGTNHPSTFGWMIPFIEAVRGGDPARVNQLILSERYGGPFASSVPLPPRLNLAGRPLLTYLDRHGL
jgi:hypothetical protein